MKKARNGSKKNLPPGNPSKKTGFTNANRIDELLGINQKVSEISPANVETLDLHGYTLDDAKIELDNFLNFVDKNIDEVHVVHGYHSGNAIKNYLKHDFRHKRVKKNLHSVNQGITILVLKK